MGYIKEPKGVDFFIKSEPLNDEARKEISEYIKAYKARQHAPKKTSVKNAKGTTVSSQKKNKIKFAK